MVRMSFQSWAFLTVICQIFTENPLNSLDCEMKPNNFGMF